MTYGSGNRVAQLGVHTQANLIPVPTMRVAAPFLVPVLAVILTVDPQPVPTIRILAPASSFASARAVAQRIPAVRSVIELYRGSVRPKIGYGSRPKKHIRVGVSISF